MASIRLGKQPVTDAVMHNAHGATFPLMRMKFEKSTKGDDYELTVKVGSKLYDFLTEVYGQDSAIGYFSIDGGQIGVWTIDMNISIDILQKLKIIDETSSWLIHAREAIAAELSGSQIESIRKRPDALKTTKEILKSAGFLEEVDANKYLFGIAKDVVSEKRKDPDTIIYRLAMALFHSEANAGKPAVQGIEEPSKAYLNFIADESFISKYKELLDRFVKFDSDIRIIVLKTFLCFLVGAYLYYSVTNG